MVFNDEEGDEVKDKRGREKITSRKWYALLYLAIFALILSGCSLSGLADGNRSAVKGYGITTEAFTDTEGGSSEYLGGQESATEEIPTDQQDKKSGGEAAADQQDKKAGSETAADQQDKKAGSENAADQSAENVDGEVNLADIPAYAGAAYCEINGNVPGFNEDELTTDAFENYSELDSLGRCGVAYANICKEIMPTEKRGEIGMVKPSGWHTVKYNDRIDGNYLYNRCHLIGYQLAGENANVKKLITGTRYLNVTGMLPFENEVADYVESTDNHVLYRVTPVFDGDNLVASGVQMEAESVEDGGAGVSFNVFVYNVQPGVVIDYATGDSEADPDYTTYGNDNGSDGSSEVTDGATGADQEEAAEDGDTEKTEEDADENGTEAEQPTDQSEAVESTYIVNTNTGKFHRPDCSSVKRMKESNKSEITTTRDELISEGYEPCKNCNP